MEKETHLQVMQTASRPSNNKIIKQSREKKFQIQKTQKMRI